MLKPGSFFKSKMRAPIFILLLLLVAAPGAGGTTLVHMDVVELAHTAQVVARARCRANSTRWEDGHLWTLTTFDVLELWKSTALWTTDPRTTAPRTITVRLVGGRDRRGTVLVDGVPQFRPGEEVVLFLEPSAAPSATLSAKGEFTVTSWAQGTFRVRRDRLTHQVIAVQDTSGLRVFEPATRTVRAGGLRRIPLVELHQRVLRASAGAGRNPS